MKKIELVEFDASHLPETYKWMMDEDLKKDFMLSVNVTPESHRKWYENYIKDTTQKIWAILYEDKHVGNIGLKNIDYRNQKAETWIYIGEKSVKGKGVGTDSYKELFLNNEFKIMKLHKIYCHVAEWNEASCKMFLKNSFIEEAVLIDEVRIDNKFRNLKRLFKIIN